MAIIERIERMSLDRNMLRAVREGDVQESDLRGADVNRFFRVGRLGSVLRGADGDFGGIIRGRRMSILMIAAELQDLNTVRKLRGMKGIVAGRDEAVEIAHGKSNVEIVKALVEGAFITSYQVEAAQRVLFARQDAVRASEEIVNALREEVRIGV